MTQKKSPWYSTPREKRRSKPLGVNLLDSEREALERLANDHEAPLSRIVAAAILAFKSVPSWTRRDLIEQSVGRVAAAARKK